MNATYLDYPSSYKFDAEELLKQIKKEREALDHTQPTDH